MFAAGKNEKLENLAKAFIFIRISFPPLPIHNLFFSFRAKHPDRVRGKGIIRRSFIKKRNAPLEGSKNRLVR